MSSAIDPALIHASGEAERYLVECIEAERIADFSQRPEAARSLDACFVARLISHSMAGAGHLHGALRMRGAHLVGPLRALPGGAGRPTLLFRDCTFDGPVDLSGGEFLALRFVDCDMVAFIGASIATAADLDLSGSRFSGVTGYECELSEVGTCAIHLSNARIGGRLKLHSSAANLFATSGTVRLIGARIDGSVSFEGARLDGCGDGALDARSMNVGGDVNFDWRSGRRFEATGEIALAASRIVGDVIMRGVRLHNPQGRALHCEDLRVESVFLTAHDNTPFEAVGRLNFLSAIVGGSFFLSSARLAPGPDTDLLGRGGPVAINLPQLRVSNALVMRNVGALDPDGPPPSKLDPPLPVRGWFLLTGAELNVILDDPQTGWPAAGYLDLEGATYEQLRGIGGGETVARRIAWLRLLYPDGRPTPETFRPQPYEALSRVLRQHGQSREADAIAVEKIRMRLAARADPGWARVLPRILMLVSQHGYSSSRAIGSFLLFVLLGAVLYGVALNAGQTFIPFESAAGPVVYDLPLDFGQIAADRGCPGLDVLYFALDAALPVISLGQDTYCRFEPQGPWRNLWMLLHSIYVLAGTALSAVVVLTLTGVLRRD